MAETQVVTVEITPVAVSITTAAQPITLGVSGNGPAGPVGPTGEASSFWQYRTKTHPMISAAPLW